MGQSAVSRIEDGEYSGWTFKTLAKVAEKMDAQLRIMLVPSEDVIGQYWAEEGQSSGSNQGEGGRKALEKLAPSLMLGEQQGYDEPQRKPPLAQLFRIFRRSNREGPNLGVFNEN